MQHASTLVPTSPLMEPLGARPAFSEQTFRETPISARLQRCPRSLGPLRPPAREAQEVCAGAAPKTQSGGQPGLRSAPLPPQPGHRRGISPSCVSHALPRHTAADQSTLACTPGADPTCGRGAGRRLRASPAGPPPPPPPPSTAASRLPHGPAAPSPARAHGGCSLPPPGPGTLACDSGSGSRKRGQSRRRGHRVRSPQRAEAARSSRWLRGRARGGRAGAHTAEASRPVPPRPPSRSPRDSPEAGPGPPASAPPGVSPGAPCPLAARPPPAAPGSGSPRARASAAQGPRSSPPQEVRPCPDPQGSPLPAAIASDPRGSSRALLGVPQGASSSQDQPRDF